MQREEQNLICDIDIFDKIAKLSQAKQSLASASAEISLIIYSTPPTPTHSGKYRNLKFELRQPQ